MRKVDRLLEEIQCLRLMDIAFQDRRGQARNEYVGRVVLDIFALVNGVSGRAKDKAIPGPESAQWVRERLEKLYSEPFPVAVGQVIDWLRKEERRAEAREPEV